MRAPSPIAFYPINRRLWAYGMPQGSMRRLPSKIRLLASLLTGQTGNQYRGIEPEARKGADLGQPSIAQRRA